MKRLSKNSAYFPVLFVFYLFGFSGSLQAQLRPSVKDGDSENPRSGYADSLVVSSLPTGFLSPSAIEVVEKRDEFTKHFANEDGTYTAMIGAGPVHYLEDNQWKTILTHFIPNTGAEFQQYPLAVLHNRQKIYAPQNPNMPILSKMDGKIYKDWGEPSMVWLDENGNILAEVQANEQATASAQEDVLWFASIFPGIDAEIRASVTSKKLNYHIQSPSAIANAPQGAAFLAFREKVAIPSDWTFSSTPSSMPAVKRNRFKNYSAFEFSDPNGEVMVQLENPLFYDRVPAGNCDETPDTAKLNDDYQINGDFLIKKISSTEMYVLTRIPVQWLTASTRRFPLTIDPTTNYYPGNGSNWTHTVSRSDNSGGWGCYFTTSNGRINNYDISYGWVDGNLGIFGSNPYLDGYATFDIGGVPDNAYINSATNYWFPYGGRACGDPIRLKHGMVLFNTNLVGSSCNTAGFSIRNNNAYYNGTGLNAPGQWRSQAASTADVTSALLGNQLGMGWAYNGGDDCCTFFCSGDDGNYHHVFGYQNSTYRPYIAINYCVRPTITAQPANRSICTSGTMTPISVTVSGTALTYQWQVSNYTACSGAPAASWQNIPGATAASYTPPKIAGTRLYRCVVTASDCNAGTSGMTVNSNCAQVVVNPMNGTTTAPVNFPSPQRLGDNAPSIIFSNCGGLVLPGSTHTLSTLQPPAIGAVNAVGYSWSISPAGGSFSGSSSVTWTAPTAVGNYVITLTYTTPCGNLTTTCNVEVGAPNCDYAYVASNGTDAVDRGGPDNPYATLAYAISQLGGRRHIKMATGTYSFSSRANIPSNVIIEGRFDAENGWRKQNDGNTNITFTNSAGNISSSGNDIRHLIGMSANGTSGWTLQDLNITTSTVTGNSTSGNGSSNYALWLSGASNYQIIRCNIISGAASQGTNGANGGNGGNGGSGGNANTADNARGRDRCGGDGGGTGQPGGAGGTAGVGANNGTAGETGGKGGNGASDGGGGCCTGQTGSSTSCASGSAGSGSSNGTNDGSGLTGGSCNTVGSNGSNGSTVAATYTSGFYVPSYGTNGTGGGRGGGGGGGGGGGRNTDGCDASGNGASGGGGGGGGGGGAWGARGGGSSFGIFLWNNGTGGSIVSSQINTGTEGALRTGGTGGNGGNGGSGGPRNNQCWGCGRVNKGGAGGNGSAGGKGGNGGNANAGVRRAIARQGSGSNNPTLTNISPTITINTSVSGGSVPTSPVVRVLLDKARPCINSEINLYKASGTWALPTGLTFVNDRNETAGATSYTTATQNIKVYSTTASAVYNLTAPADFPGLIRMASDNRPLPIISATAPTSMCAGPGAQIQLNHTNPWNTQVEYEWVIFSASGNNANTALITSTLNNPLIDLSSLPAGSYKVRYRVKEICCGWSRPVYLGSLITITEQPSQPSNLTKTAGSNFAQVCEGATALSVNPASGSTGGTGTCNYEYSFQNTTGAWSNWNVAVPSITAGPGPGFVRIKARRNCNGLACDLSSETPEVVWEVVEQPEAGAVSRVSPTTQAVCIGANLTATSSGGTGGVAGTDEIQWRNGTTGVWSNYTGAVSTATHGTGNYYFRTRRVSNGYGCATTAWEPVNGVELWVVEADPSVDTQPIGTIICPGDAYTISTTIANGAGLTYQWQYSTNGTNWFNVGTDLPAIGFSYINDQTADMTINTTAATPPSTSYRFRCSVTSNAGCNPNPLYTDPAVVNVVFGNINPGYRTWTGMVSQNWLETLNWDCGGVPTATIDVIIPEAPRYPVITTGQFAECNTIQVQENGPPTTIIVEVQDGGNLKVDSP